MTEATVVVGTKESPLKVSKNTNPKSIAGALAGLARDGMTSIEVSVIGAGATNQAVKAVAIARGYLAPAGKDLFIVPSFADVVIAGEDRTAMSLTVEVR